jgi:tRNA(Glu) U13 pseudouridine synthase TruD
MYSCFVCSRALLAENWEEAVNLIIAGSGNERQPFRKVWVGSKDPRKTLDLVENKHFIEKVILRSLIKRPTDYFGAIGSVSKTV